MAINQVVFVFFFVFFSLSSFSFDHQDCQRTSRSLFVQSTAISTGLDGAPALPSTLCAVCGQTQKRPRQGGSTRDNDNGGQKDDQDDQDDRVRAAHRTEYSVRTALLGRGKFPCCSTGLDLSNHLQNTLQGRTLK